MFSIVLHFNNGLDKALEIIEKHTGGDVDAVSD